MCEEKAKKYGEWKGEMLVSFEIQSTLYGRPLSIL